MVCELHFEVKTAILVIAINTSGRFKGRSGRPPAVDWMHLKNGEHFAQNAQFLLKILKNFLGRADPTLPFRTLYFQVLDPPLIIIYNFIRHSMTAKKKNKNKQQQARNELSLIHI